MVFNNTFRGWDGWREANAFFEIFTDCSILDLEEWKQKERETEREQIE